MTSDRTFAHIASFLTLLFSASVFIWKPGIYVSSGLITAYLLARTAIDQDYRRLLWNSRITQISLAMFMLGLITSTIGAEQFKDIAWMARKTLFIPVIIFLVFALAQQRNRTIAQLGLIGSFWIASILTLHENNWQLSFGGRMGGTWPIGTWDALMGMFFVFMALSQKPNCLGVLWRGILVVTTMMALLMLVLAGGRAPWIGVLLSMAIYFAVFNRNKRVWLAATTGAIIIAILAGTVFEDKARPVVERLSTVVNTTTVGSSNWIRLQLWQIGLAHMETLAVENTREFLFGGGAESYDPKQIEFFKTMPFDETAREMLKDQGYPSGDAHNNYIDSALRHGILWTFAITVYLIWLCSQFSWTAVRSNPAPLILLFYLLIVGAFYTVVPHFLTFFFALFIAMLMSSQPPDIATRKVERRASLPA